jgi:PHD/YefM family antitoxin component YafN of YafNO toxin-antitoxin module
MIVLKLKDSGAVAGRISEDDFQFLVDQLEEESEEDTDYFISAETIELLRQRGGGENLMSILKQAATGSAEGVELSWSRE